MGKFLRLSGGVARQFTESSAVAIYDQQLTIVSGSPANSNQMTGPVNAGVSVTLPQSGTYSSAELQVQLNGQQLEPVLDYTYVGSGTRTQVQFTFQLVVGDVVDFRVDRVP
jgi:hypothetical protein